MMRLLALTILLSSACAQGPGPLEFQPNLVLIVADDLGYEDLGFTGSPIVAAPSPSTSRSLLEPGARASGSA